MDDNEKNCQNCGIKFSNPSGRWKFCSKKCYMAYEPPQSFSKSKEPEKQRESWRTYAAAALNIDTCVDFNPKHLALHQIAYQIGQFADEMLDQENKRFGGNDAQND